MRAVAPDAPIIDVSHGVLPGVVEHGARLIADVLRYLPLGVVLGVIDPGVGGPRRAIVVEAKSGQLFVGPDNGLFWPALEQAGGPMRAFDIGASVFAAQEISPTFHGRDIFAPVAANLAFGEPVNHAGRELAISELLRLDLSRATSDGRLLTTRVVDIDHFGNVKLDAHRAQLEGTFMPGARYLVTAGDHHITAAFALTFADVEAGAALLFEDANKALAVATNRSNAAHLLNVAFGDTVTIGGLFPE